MPIEKSEFKDADGDRQYNRKRENDRFGDYQVKEWIMPRGVIDG